MILVYITPNPALDSHKGRQSGDCVLFCYSHNPAMRLSRWLHESGE